VDPRKLPRDIQQGLNNLANGLQGELLHSLVARGGPLDAEKFPVGGISSVVQSGTASLTGGGRDKCFVAIVGSTKPNYGSS